MSGHHDTARDQAFRTTQVTDSRSSKLAVPRYLFQRSRTGCDGSRLADRMFVLAPSEHEGTEAPVVAFGAVGLNKAAPSHQVVIDKHPGFKRPAADLTAVAAE
jgi:hypothetical protein